MAQSLGCVLRRRSRPIRSDRLHTLLAKIRLVPSSIRNLWRCTLLCVCLSAISKHSADYSAKRNALWVSLSTGWKGWAEAILAVTQLTQVLNISGMGFQYLLSCLLLINEERPALSVLISIHMQTGDLIRPVTLRIAQTNTTRFPKYRGEGYIFYTHIRNTLWPLWR